MYDRISPPFRDSLTQDQFFSTFKRTRALEPERELMLAVLADAVECYWKYGRARDGIGMRLFRDAQEWLFSDDEERAFSFVNICSALQLEPGYIRRGIFARQSNILVERRNGTSSRMLPPKYVRRNLNGRRNRAVRSS
jgi:hypothetical protein